MQATSPAALVAETLQDVLDDRVSEYTYVDFCAGAGGPTPYIEQDLNQRLAKSAINGFSNRNQRSRDGVHFVLTDIAPHLDAWEKSAKKSDNLHFVPSSVDAANAPRNILQFVLDDRSPKKKVFRLFSLAFHHFDDAMAAKILINSIDTSDGFGIFELQKRTLSSLLTVTLMWPLLLLISPLYFWRSPGHLFFTYVIPIIPFVVVFDGWVSSLRTRNAEEILDILGQQCDVSGWQFGHGNECHTYPIGEMTWFIGVKKSTT